MGLIIETRECTNQRIKKTGTWNLRQWGIWHEIQPRRPFAHRTVSLSLSLSLSLLIMRCFLRPFNLFGFGLQLFWLLCFSLRRRRRRVIKLSPLLLKFQLLYFGLFSAFMSSALTLWDLKKKKGIYGGSKKI